MNATSESIQQAWDEFHRTRDPLSYHRLFSYGLASLRLVAENISAKLPFAVELEDLRSAGAIGLVCAIEAFDPERGVSFTTYCRRRIRGAILGSLRESGWKPKFVMDRAREFDRARQALESRLGHTPSEQELAAELSLNMDSLRRLQVMADAVGLLSLYEDRRCSGGQQNCSSQ